MNSIDIIIIFQKPVFKKDEEIENDPSKSTIISSKEDLYL